MKNPSTMNTRTKRVLDNNVLEDCSFNSPEPKKEEVKQKRTVRHTNQLVFFWPKNV